MTKSTPNHRPSEYKLYSPDVVDLRRSDKLEYHCFFKYKVEYNIDMD